jgi:hypothetical protein
MKRFLPAIMRYSPEIGAMYRDPIYGTSVMPSHNFSNQVWYVSENGLIADPYSLLNPIFEDTELSEAIRHAEPGEAEFVANGAKAMIAYGMLQDQGLPRSRREELRRQLLRYCELDTLAMVMAYQAIMGWLRRAKS